jgi:xanthine dehydrogenase accessory factor
MEAADIAQKAILMEGRAVLATIVNVEGHAYRKAGASMLLEADGGASGSVSPGCLEADLKLYVEPVLREGICQWIEYDMRAEDDFSWGEAIGCGGFVRILLEPVTGKLLSALKETATLLELGEDAVLIRRFGESALPESYAVKPKPGNNNSGMAAEDGEFLQSWEAKPRVVLFGGGDDAIAVARLARMAGFRPTVADFRESVLTPSRFPGAELRYGFPAELAGMLDLSARDYVVIMSHQYQRDREFLRIALQSGPRYIGIMGSASRTRRMLEGVFGDIPSSVRYPVGLPIGADGPDEIAISIAAELIGVRRKGHVGIGNADRGALFGSRLEPANGKAEAAP